MLHITAGNIYGGIERTLETVALESDACSRMKSEIAVCYRGRFASEIEAAGLPVHYLGETRARKPWTVMRARQALDRVIQDRKIDVIVTHASWPHAMFAPVGKRRGIPVVLWLHAAFRGKTWLERWAARTSADAVIFNSRFTGSKSQLPSWQIPTKVIYNPVRHQTVSDGQERVDRITTRRELGVGVDDFVIAHIARIENLKGHALLLSALALLPAESQWVCWVVGASASLEGDQLLKELKESAQMLGISDRIRFLGERSDIAHILAASDALVQPNIEPDAFGNAVIEALWHRLPVIATDMGGPAEILASDYGVLVPPADPVALSAAIGKLISSPTSMDELRERGPRRAFELCDPAIQLNKLCSFFEDVVRHRSGSTP